MGLFYLVKNSIQVSPHTLLISQFSDIYSRDKTKDKLISMKELAYVYYTADYKSVYNSYADEDRDSILIEDLFGKDSRWKPDAVVLRAVSKYEELQQVPALRLLKSVRKALNELTLFFDTPKLLSQRNNRGVLDYKPGDITKAMGETGRIIEGIDKLEDKVRKELQESVKARGGEAAGIFEDHDF